MDVALGVAIVDRGARLALVAADGDGVGTDSVVIDNYALEVADDPIGVLTATIVGTNESLTAQDHRLMATRLCWGDLYAAEELRRALQDSGVRDVVVISTAQATESLSGSGLSLNTSAINNEAPPTMLAPVVGDSDGVATVLGSAWVDPDAPPTVAVPTFALSSAGAGPTLPSGDATLTLALGAALSGISAGVPSAADATMLAPLATAATVALAGEPTDNGEDAQLAYSEADAGYDYPGQSDYGPFDGQFDDGQFDDDPEYGDAKTEPWAPHGRPGNSSLDPRALLIRNAVLGFAVLGFSSLAVAVVITVRPLAASEPLHNFQNAQPGKFMPLLPTQNQAPVPAPPADNPTAGFQGGTVPIANTLVPRGTAPKPVAPAPQRPGGVVPIPIPIPIPLPGTSPKTVTVYPTTPATTSTTPETTTATTTAATSTAPTTTAATTSTAPTSTAPTGTTTAPTTTAVPTTTAAVTTTVAPITTPATTAAEQPTTVAPAPVTPTPASTAAVPTSAGPAIPAMAPATEAPAAPVVPVAPHSVQPAAPIPLPHPAAPAPSSKP